jgi:hypothetical protein
MTARNPEFERKHPRDAEGQFTEKAGGSAPRWMQDLDEKIALETKRREAARQPGYVPPPLTEAQRFAAAAMTPHERDAIGPPIYGGLSVESARPTTTPQRVPGAAIQHSVSALVRDTGLRLDKVTGIGLQALMARMANKEFTLEQLPAEVDLFGTKTWARGKRDEARLIHALAKDLDQVITGRRRENLAEQFSPDRVFAGFPWRPVQQHPGVMYPPIGYTHLGPSRYA